MLIKRPTDIKSHEITEPAVYRDRRRFLQASSGAALAVAAGASGLLMPAQAEARRKLEYRRNPRLSTDESPNSLKDITRYNNFYEFGTSKEDPAKNAHTLRTEPWTVRVEGEVEKPADYHLEDLIKSSQLEERIIACAVWRPGRW